MKVRLELSLEINFHEVGAGTWCRSGNVSEKAVPLQFEACHGFSIGRVLL